MQLDQIGASVTNLAPEEARGFINNHKEGTYTLLDVRQPGEYEKSRIPGARLVPLPQLADRLEELDPQRPIITY
ncbi:MAG: rhodanese-like domain-containing protein [Thermodesulfobacteriota bacterium]